MGGVAQSVRAPLRQSKGARFEPGQVHTRVYRENVGLTARRAAGHRPASADSGTPDTCPATQVVERPIEDREVSGSRPEGRPASQASLAPSLAGSFGAAGSGGIDGRTGLTDVTFRSGSAGPGAPGTSEAPYRLSSGGPRCTSRRKQPRHQRPWSRTTLRGLLPLRRTTTSPGWLPLQVPLRCHFRIVGTRPGPGVGIDACGWSGGSHGRSRQKTTPSCRRPQ